MSNRSTVDRESFQKLLASAFAVQQSQMDPQSIRAFVESGRLVTSGHLDVDGAVRLIVDGTRNPANTTGADTGLLSGAPLHLPGLEEDDRSCGVFLSHLASTLSAHSDEAVSTDIALDLALNDIAEQARLATNAGAAAIALMGGEEMVCRASTGKSAPELGGLLDARTGLSGDCTRTKEMQCCADTEADSHIDAVACRCLGIRSFLILPLIKQSELVGLFGIFFLHPRAFGDREIQTLQALSRQVLIPVDCALEFSTPPPGHEPTSANSIDACLATFQVHPPEVKTARFGLHDLRTRLPVILVIVLALLLGWMVGRGTWLRNAPKKGPPVMVSEKPDVAPLLPKETRQAGPRPPVPQKSSPETPSDSLVVYQDGKVIFRLKPSQAHGESSAPNSVLVSPAKAKVRLVQRVEPEYPEEARQQHIQGPVVLETKVGEGGEVQELTVISGNPMLATAASDAVLKWRFKPLVQKGRAVQFQTRITVDFVLP